jgi:hypothetical protein
MLFQDILSILCILEMKCTLDLFRDKCSNWLQQSSHLRLPSVEITVMYHHIWHFAYLLL